MSTFTQILYQIVFSTKHRKECLTSPEREILFKYITGILLNKKCHVYSINGVKNHLHIICSVHPSVSVSSLIKDIKVASSLYIKQNQLFHDFNGWQDGYGAFTYSVGAKQKLIDYVNNQEEHHQSFSFRDEYIRLLNENDIHFDEKYLF
jgi:putative transposase